MTYPPKDVFTMWDRVNDVLTAGADVWSTDDAICKAVFRFRLLRNEIIDVVEAATVADAIGTTRAPITTLSSEGTLVDNDVAKQSAVTAALPIAQAIRNWAERTDNDAIARNMSLDSAELQDMRDTMTADYLRLVHTTGVSNMGELGSYGVAQPALDDLMGKIRAFESVNPRAVAGHLDAGGVEGGAFDEIIRDGMALLNDTLDPAVERLSGNSPGFVEAYKAARSGMDTGPSEEPPTAYKL
jgi:hypothetical protein